MKIVQAAPIAAAVLPTATEASKPEAPLDAIDRSSRPATKPALDPRLVLASAVKNATAFEVSQEAEAAVSKSLKALARGEGSLASAEALLKPHMSPSIKDVLVFYHDAIRDDLDEHTRARFDADCQSLLGSVA